MLCISATLGMAQGRTKTQLLGRFEVDSIHDLNAIRTAWFALPPNLEQEANILDSVMRLIQKERQPGFEAIWGAEQMASYQSVMLGYQRLKETVEDTRSMIREIEAANFRLSQRIRSGQLDSEIIYEKERKVRKSQLARLRFLRKDITRKGKRIARNAFFYIQNMAESDAPVMSTLVAKYLYINRRENIDKLESQWNDELKKFALNNELLEQEQELAEQRLNELKLQMIDLDKGRSRLMRDGLALKVQNDSIAAAQQDMEQRLLLDIQKWQSRMISVQKEIGHQRKTLMDSLSARVQHVGQLKLSSAALEQRITALNDSIGRLESNEKEVRRQLRRELEWKEVWKRAGYLSAIFLPIIGFLYYKKRQFERASKKRTDEANAQLRQINDQLLDKKELLETLVQELHHRTKNNLQQVSSLLFLHAREVQDVEAKEVLNEARGRIEALGIVHRLLYKNPQERPTFIHLTEYAKELVGHLATSTKTRKEDFATQYSLPDMVIEMDVATHIGLILNELIHNCFKHAFPMAKERPMLFIGGELNQETLTLSVRDNGPGMSASDPLENTSSFGLKFVRKLIEKSGGSIRYSGEQGGACFMVEIPLSPNQYFQAKG